MQTKSLGLRAFNGNALLILIVGLMLTVFALGKQKLAAKKQALPNNCLTISYMVDNTAFPNPERGFYLAYQPTGGGLVGQQDTPHPPLVASELRALRARPEAITLIRDNILIPRKFWTQPISQEYLNELQGNFDAVRAAGLKTIPRFLYDWSMQNRDPDEAVINRHLDQLTPLIKKNADVIAWMQGGLFGGSGEGNDSDHGYVYPKYTPPGSSMKWQGLSPAGRRLLLKELQILPPERMLNVRYPRMKWDLFEWDSGTAMQHALTPTTAFNKSNAARVGFYNDGFMGSPEHYAMFQLPNEAQFTAQDSGFVVHEGEISDASSYKLQDDQVVTDTARYRLTALYCGGDDWPKVVRAWQQNNDYDMVARRMGYRFRLTKATLPRLLRPGGSFVLDLKMVNDGFARAINPREIEVILRNTKSGAQYAVSVKGERDNRLWLPGPGEGKPLRVVAGVPATMPPGNYEVLLNLPDPKPALHGRSDYSIRLANKGVWEVTTGFNRMLHTLKIDRAADGALYSGSIYFTPRGR